MQCAQQSGSGARPSHHLHDCEPFQNWEVPHSIEKNQNYQSLRDEIQWLLLWGGVLALARLRAEPAGVLPRTVAELGLAGYKHGFLTALWRLRGDTTCCGYWWTNAATQATEGTFEPLCAHPMDSVPGLQRQESVLTTALGLVAPFLVSVLLNLLFLLCSQIFQPGKNHAKEQGICFPHGVSSSCKEIFNFLILPWGIRFRSGKDTEAQKEAEGFFSPQGDSSTWHRMVQWDNQVTATLGAGGLVSPVALCCWDTGWQQVGVCCFVGSQLSGALPAPSTLRGRNTGASQHASPALPVWWHNPEKMGRAGPSCTCPRHLSLSLSLAAPPFSQTCLSTHSKATHKRARVLDSHLRWLCTHLKWSPEQEALCSPCPSRCNSTRANSSHNTVSCCFSLSCQKPFKSYRPDAIVTL